MKLFIIGLPNSGNLIVSNEIRKYFIGNIVDNILSPKDFVDDFNYNDDIVVFLNRIDNDLEQTDSDNIAVSVIRDYCYWMSSMKMLDRDRWLEYNFKIPGEDNDYVKCLGFKNKVFLVKSIDKVISHLKNYLT